MALNTYKNYFLIPVSICQYVLTQKMVTTFQVYMAMKSLSSGIMNVDTGMKNKIAAQLNLTTRTIELELKKLVRLNWVGKKNKTYYVRSFMYLQSITGSEIKTGVIFEKSELRTLRAFLIGAVIGYLVNVNRLKIKRENKRASGYHKKKGYKSTEALSLSYMPVANIVIAKILNCSLSTASVYKNEAYNCNYIEVVSNFKTYPLQPNHIEVFKKAQPDIAKRLRLVDGKVCEMMPDKVLSLMKFKKRKNPIHKPKESSPKQRKTAF